MKSKQFLLILLVLYVGAAIGTYSVRAMLDTSPKELGSTDQVVPEDGSKTLLGQLLTIDPAEPKDQVCPLNGMMYTKTEANAWAKRRPLAVMIENSPDARPQSGLSKADIVFEAVAEGGVTRFMAMFYCGVQVADISLAPVRSARTYFVDWASGFNRPLYVHVGGANTPGPANALGQISDYGWALENDLNQFSIGYPTFVRNAARLDHEVATEHTMETTTEKLWAVAEKREWTNMSPEMKIGRTVVPSKDWKEGYIGWKFGDSSESVGTTTSIAYDFWSGYNQFSVKWQFDSATKTYKRILAGEPHIDLNTNQQIAARVVIVMLTAEKGPIDEVKHMLYKTTGSGKALIYQNGQAITATWTKKTRESELQFTDTKGKEVELQPGLVWISVVDDSTTVTASGV